MEYIKKTAYHLCKASFVTITVVLLSAGNSLPSPLPGRVAQTMHTLPVLKYKNQGLCKRTQGQVPAAGIFSSLSIIPGKGIKEILTYQWNTEAAPGNWGNYERQVYAYNGRGKLSADTAYSFSTATQTWEISGKSVYIYNARDLMTSDTEYTMVNGHWQPKSFSTYGYNQVDSMVYFATVEWDNGLNAWKSASPETDSIFYNADAKIDTLKMDLNLTDGRGRFVIAYAYLPDGKVDREEMNFSSSNSSYRIEYIHRYPDTLSEVLAGRIYAELLTEGLNYDSVFIRYARTGQVSEYRRYSWSTDSYGWNANEQASVTYDAKGRPQESISMIGNQNSWVNHQKIVYSYNAAEVMHPASRPASGAGRIHGSITSDRTVILSGFSGNSARISVELRDMKGATVCKCRAFSRNGAVSFKTDRALAQGYYSCIVRQADQTHRIGMVWAR
jgi:hypothetical protein